MVFKKKTGKSLSKHFEKLLICALLCKNAESHIGNIKKQKSMNFVKSKVPKKKKNSKTQQSLVQHSSVTLKFLIMQTCETHVIRYRHYELRTIAM